MIKPLGDGITRSGLSHLQKADFYVKKYWCEKIFRTINLVDMGIAGATRYANVFDDFLDILRRGCGCSGDDKGDD